MRSGTKRRVVPTSPLVLAPTTGVVRIMLRSLMALTTKAVVLLVCMDAALTISTRLSAQTSKVVHAHLPHTDVALITLHLQGDPIRTVDASLPSMDVVQMELLKRPVRTMKAVDALLSNTDAVPMELLLQKDLPSKGVGVHTANMDAVPTTEHQGTLPRSLVAVSLANLAAVLMVQHKR